MFRLTVRDARGQRTLAVDRTELLVGGREGADVQLIDAQVAPNHCLLRVEGDRVRVLDLGPGGGVVRAGQPVRDVLVAPGSVLRLGTALLRLDAFGAGVLERLSLEPDPPAPPARPEAQAGAPPPGAGTSPAAEAASASEFARELRRMLSNAPWYGISLVAHLVALMILQLIPVGPIAVRSEHPIQAELSRTAELPEPPEKESLLPDIASLRPEDTPDEAADVGLPVLEDVEGPTVFDPSRVGGEPELLGIQGPFTGRLTKPLRRPTLIDKPGTRIDRGDIDGEHRGAREAVERGLGTGIENLRGIPPDRIVVVRGEFDHMEKILALYGIPHTVVSRDELRTRRWPRMRMLCINCDQLPPPLQSATLATAVKRFVAEGGWLITSDWAVDPYLLSGWPQRVTGVVQKKRDQPDTIITVRPERISPLLEGVFEPRARAEWWLENSSMMVEVDPRLVDVLIVSDDMKKRFGASAVAFTWRQDEGRVLHLLGHFYQKDGNRSGLVAMHRLILNYMVERFQPR